MDELTLIRQFRDHAPASGPSPAVRQRVVRAVDPPRRSPNRRVLAVGAVSAATVVTAVTIGVQVGPGAEPSAATVLDEAADTVARQPVSEPLPHQWVFESYREAGPDGQPPTQTSLAWTRFDGRRFANPPSDSDPGRIQVESLTQVDGIPSPREWYEGVAALPDDPQALLAELRNGDLVRGQGATQAARDFDAVTSCLSIPRVLPANAHARLFRALATIPGVGIDDDVADDVLGRDVLAVTFSGDTENGSSVRNRHELLLDPKTYAYRGERVTALEDGTLSDGEHVTDGQVWFNSAIAETGVVDRVGQQS